MHSEDWATGRDMKVIEDLPYMLFADRAGRIYDHPYYRMAGFSALSPHPIDPEELLPMPEFSKLFYLPECPPIGLDPETGEYVVVPYAEIRGRKEKIFAVAAFPEPGVVRTHIPAADYSKKRYLLPAWAYTAVGFRDDRYWICGFWIEKNYKWDPRNYDDRELLKKIKEYTSSHKKGRLVRHLIDCALKNHCFAAKNLFFERWEAPLPVSRTCNARCLGCLSFQPKGSFPASHERIRFTPTKEEIVEIAVAHLENAPDAIVSFGQGCEGEPLMEYKLIAESIKEIRKRTKKGTINLNTNGSDPEKIRVIAESGLDSIRISLNSVRPAIYKAYYRPKNYDYEDVIRSIRVSKEMGLYTMINYLIFPGISDQEEEVFLLKELVKETKVDFIHLKNLCIDPVLYVENIPAPQIRGIGMKKMADAIKRYFPDIELGYFNRSIL